MPLPVSRGGRKALLQRKSAAVPSCAGATRSLQRALRLLRHPGHDDEDRNQLAAAAGTSRWRFMTILLSAPR